MDFVVDLMAAFPAVLKLVARWLVVASRQVHVCRQSCASDQVATAQCAVWGVACRGYWVLAVVMVKSRRS